ncbi:MAG: hypothetical protein IKT81_03190, partial [Clostridia bacterium]|nr:hypothetical protein [Clostridia bacterium]
KKRIIPLICLIIVSVAVLSLLMLNCGESEHTEPSLQEVYDEINAARSAVRRLKTPETEKYFVSGAPEAIYAIQNCVISYEDNQIKVILNYLNDGRLKILKKVFPYDCIVYEGEQHPAAPT